MPERRKRGGRSVVNGSSAQTVTEGVVLTGDIDADLRRLKDAVTKTIIAVAEVAAEQDELWAEYGQLRGRWNDAVRRADELAAELDRLDRLRDATEQARDERRSRAELYARVPAKLRSRLEARSRELGQRPHSVLVVLAAEPRRVFGAAEVTDALANQGIDTTVASVRVQLARLVDSRDVDRLSPGRFRFRMNPGAGPMPK